MSRAYMFCDRCGTMLDMVTKTSSACCEMCGFSRPFSEFSDASVTTSCGPKDFIRRYGIEPLVGEDMEKQSLTKGKDRERATVDEECPKCQNRGLEYYTMQLRSADEGQTVFYECMKETCRYKFSQNN
mmetsp:Transcript_48335/g.154773  ORF Transcript_48335/g.154773 Transcript_48335/m.154773 type:complete len:128 (+) Transcript_48335:148-531(+)